MSLWKQQTDEQTRIPTNQKDLALFLSGQGAVDPSRKPLAPESAKRLECGVFPRFRFATVLPTQASKLSRCIRTIEASVIHDGVGELPGPTCIRDIRGHIFPERRCDIRCGLNDVR